MKIKCAIIDDEPLAIELLANYVARVPFLELVGRWASAIEALDKIKETGVELLFLDIQMPDLNGLEFSRIVGDDIKVIFTTAFSEYALDGYKTQAIDYLLKPIAFGDFANAANKALQWFEMRNRAQSAGPDNGSNDNDTIFIRSEHKLIGIPIDDITYIEALKDYIMIHTQRQKAPIYTISTMQAAERALPPGKFMRVHRSFIVALRKITAMEGDCLIVDNRHITVSRQYRPMLLEYLAGKTVK